MTARKASFQKRLSACQRAGNLTQADLARWFDRPHATVRSWLRDGREPSGGPIDVDHANQLLGLLEALIRQKRGFPVPRLSGAARRKHVQDIRNRVLPN